MYVLSHRGMATDAEILQELIKAGKVRARGECGFRCACVCEGVPCWRCAC